MGYFWANLRDLFKALHENNMELQEGLRESGQEFIGIMKDFKTDLKDDISMKHSKLGKSVENIDRAVQSGVNVGKALVKTAQRIDPTDPQKHRPGTIVDQAAKPLQPGDHIKFDRLLYTHHAIYIGNDELIQYWKSEVRIDMISDLCGSFEIVNSPRKYDREEVVSRAISRLGETDYNVLFNNCEQFAIWCRSGSEMTGNM